MSEEESQLSTGFEQAGTANIQISPAQSRDVALIVDLPLASYYEMDTEELRAYLDEMADTIQTLRDNDIHICWVTMKKQNQIFAPQSNSHDDATPYDMETMARMGFLEAEKQEGDKQVKKDERMMQHEAIATEFLEENGPMDNDTVFSKFFMSGFIMPEDYQDDPETYRQLRKQFRENVEVHFPETGDSLDRYLDKKGTEHLIVMGAFAKQCITENAMDGALHGYDVTICPDRVLTWRGKNDDLMVWGNTSHEQEIRDRITERAAERELVVSEDTGVIRFQEFSALKRTLGHTAHQQTHTEEHDSIHL